jgi:hypothetical protein
MVNKNKDRAKVIISTSGMANNFVLGTILWVGKAESDKEGGLL